MLIKSLANYFKLLPYLLKIEWRQKELIWGLIVQVFGTILAIYLILPVLPKPFWNLLFWILIMLNIFLIIVKGAMQENDGRLLYYFSIFNAKQYFWAKWILNLILSLFLSFVLFFTYCFFLSFKVEFIFVYLIALFLFVVGINSIFTFISFLSSRSGGNFFTTNVLGIPLMLPIVMIVSKLGKYAMDGIFTNNRWVDILVLIGFDMMLLLLAHILFETIWKD